MNSHAKSRRLGLAVGWVALCCAPVWSATYYADCSRPDDSGDGRTLATAKQTIQAAVDLAQAGDTVLVAKGIYEKGGRPEAPDWPMNRVCVTKPITLQAMSTDPADTVILGAPDPKPASPDPTIAAKAKGLGQAAIRCYRSTVPKGVLAGFTLKNGYTWFEPKEERYRKASAGKGFKADLGSIGGGALGGTLKNCVITACKANRGGGAGYCTLYDSVIRGCTCFFEAGAGTVVNLYNCQVLENVGDVMTFDSTAVNCVFRGNTSLGIAIAGYPAERPVYHRFFNCLITENRAGKGLFLGLADGVNQKNMPMLVNCTVVDNRFTEKGGAVFVGRRPGPAAFTIRNCIIRFNHHVNEPGVECTGQFTDDSDISYSCLGPDVAGKPYDKGGNIAGDPAFVSREHKDYRLSEASPCIDAGTAVLVPGDLLKVLPKDVIDRLSKDILNSDRPQARRAGLPAKFDMGAYEYAGPAGK